MFEYSSVDSEWGIPAWSSDCLDPSKKHEMHCCMSHFLTSSPVLHVLGGNHPVDLNIEFCGYSRPECLLKRHPCSAYLNYIDFDYVSWVGDVYSNVLPSEFHSRITSEELDVKAKGCSVFNGRLKTGETFKDLEPVVARIMKENGDKLTTRIFSRKDQLDEPLPTKVMDVMWIYCINRKWNRIELMEEFRGDPKYQLITLADGNMVLMSNLDIEKEFCFQKTNKRPTCHISPISNSDFLKSQIYIYRCLDGYFEFVGNEESALFPFANPIDEYESILGTEGQQYVTILSQMVNSGQIELTSDLDAGNDFLDSLLSPEFIQYCKDFDDTDSASSMDPEPLSSSHLKQIARTVRNQYVSKCDIPNRVSGVQGVYWEGPRPQSRHYYGGWSASVWYAGKNNVKKFYTKNHSDEESERVLELAIDHLNNVLLPNKRRWLQGGRLA